MIAVTQFTIAADYQSVDIVVNAGTGAVVNSLLFYVGSAYLTDTYIDLSSRLSGIQTETLNITKAELGITTDIIDGILTLYAENDIDETVEAYLLNSYYSSLILARKIALTGIQDSFKEVEFLYFYIEAAKLYINSGSIEQALNLYERVDAVCANYPDYMVTEDIPECAIGSGCWIINGKYVIR